MDKDVIADIVVLGGLLALAVTVEIWSRKQDKKENKTVCRSRNLLNRNLLNLYHRAAPTVEPVDLPITVALVLTMVIGGISRRSFVTRSGRIGGEADTAAAAFSWIKALEYTPPAGGVQQSGANDKRGEVWST